MKKLLFILLLPMICFSQDRFLSREIDSILAHEGGLLTTMANKSLKQQKQWRRANKSKFSKDLNKYKPKLICIEILENSKDKDKIFSHMQKNAFELKKICKVSYFFENTN